MHVYNDCIGQDGTIFVYSLLKLNKSEDKERDKDREREDDGDQSPLSSSVSSVTQMHGIGAHVSVIMFIFLSVMSAIDWLT